MNNLYFIIIVDNNIIDTISITVISKEKAEKKFLKYLCYIYSVDKDDINPIYSGFIPLSEYNLTEVVRQAKDSIIFKVSNYFRNQRR